MTGCDMTTGTCKTEADAVATNTGLTTNMKILIAVVVVLVLIVVLPGLYAMHNTRVEHGMRKQQLRARQELESLEKIEAQLRMYYHRTKYSESSSGGSVHIKRPKNVPIKIECSSAAMGRDCTHKHT